MLMEFIDVSYFGLFLALLCGLLCGRDYSWQERLRPSKFSCLSPVKVTAKINSLSDARKLMVQIKNSGGLFRISEDTVIWFKGDDLWGYDNNAFHNCVMQIPYEVDDDEIVRKLYENRWYLNRFVY